MLINYLHSIVLNYYITVIQAIFYNMFSVIQRNESDKQIGCIAALIILFSDLFNYSVAKLLIKLMGLLVKTTKKKKMRAHRVSCVYRMRRNPFGRFGREPLKISFRLCYPD